jgi:hypothetical protein
MTIIVLMLAIAAISYEIYRLFNTTYRSEKKKIYGKLLYPIIVFLIILDLLMIWDFVFTV